MADLIGPIIAAILTLFVLSYLVGDNPLYRMALHVFVGALLGYSVGVVLRGVLGQMALPRLMSEPATVVVPLALGVLLLFKGFRRAAYVGNISVAYLVGVGTAVALSGALLGTLVPQVAATGQALSRTSSATFRFGLLDGLMVVLGTVCTILAFTLTQPKDQTDGHVWLKVLDYAARVGRVFLIIVYGLAFAGALTASLSIFIGRFQVLVDLARRITGL